MVCRWCEGSMGLGVTGYGRTTVKMERARLCPGCFKSVSEKARWFLSRDPSSKKWILGLKLALRELEKAGVTKNPVHARQGAE